ncbi:MAG: elongation factor P maturation arginine rhamnosyltransferase EarP [Rhodocyclaceae bacterium]
MSLHARSWDLFCRVVDNFGDIGVSWRLARQLAGEHAIAVRLWVDDLAAFRRLCPALDPGADAQPLPGIEVRRWSEPFPDVVPRRVVIETFGCRLPETFLAAMARQEPQPVWINLEHLSAESWVEGCHGLPSPHPRLPLAARFWFPGFSERTGGLLREAGLLARRDAFVHDARRVAEFWSGIGVPPEAPGWITISLFGYPDAPIADLLEAWSRGPENVRLIAPQCGAWPALAQYFGAFGDPKRPTRRGRLELCPVAFLEQDRYDELLWASRVNFVRGEDSFVRAQWSGRAFVWQAYPQTDGAHLRKMEAFLSRYCAGLAAETAGVVGEFWRAWNTGVRPAAAWAGFRQELDAIEAHGGHWADSLARGDDLAKNLVAYVDKLL